MGKEIDIMDLEDISDEELAKIEREESEKSEEVQDEENKVLGLLKADSIFIKTIPQKPLLTREEEYELAEAISKGNKDARNELLERNLRLVASIAKNYVYVSTKFSFDDLCQSGVEGLMTAVNKFDRSKGYKFSTYATWWIRQAITRSLHNFEFIRIPEYCYLDWYKYVKWEREYIKECGKEPTEEESKDYCEQNKLRWDAVLAVKESRVSSLNAKVSNDGDESDTELGDYIEDEQLSCESLALKSCLKVDLEKAMDVCKLSEKERFIIQERFGLSGEGSKTLEEVGKQLGVTREYIRQLEDRAIRKLRSPQSRSLLIDYAPDRELADTMCKLDIYDLRNRRRGKYGR